MVNEKNKLNFQTIWLPRTSGLVVNSTIKLSGIKTALNIDQSKVFICNDKISGDYGIINNNNSRLVCISSNIKNKNTADVINHNNSRSTLLNNNTDFNLNNNKLLHIGSYNNFSNIDYPYKNIKNENIKPTLYTNGQDIFWSNDIDKSRIVYLAESYNYPADKNIFDKIPTDLQRNTINFILTQNDQTFNGKDVHNGYIHFTPENKTTSYNLTLLSCNFKVTLENFTFNKLTIENCLNVKIVNCKFKNSQTRVTTSTLPKKMVLNRKSSFFKDKINVFAIGLLLKRSRVFISNYNISNKDTILSLYFKDYDFSIFACEKSSVYINSFLYIDQKIDINTSAFRPIIFGAFEGSQIFYHGNPEEKINVKIICKELNYNDTNYHPIIFRTEGQLLIDVDNPRTEKYRELTIPLVIEFKDLNSIINHRHIRYLNEIPSSIVVLAKDGILCGAIYRTAYSTKNNNETFPINGIWSGSNLFNNNMFLNYNNNGSTYPLLNDDKLESKFKQVSPNTSKKEYTIIPGSFKLS